MRKNHPSKMRKHAYFSPSAAHRWLHCTAAPKREERYPDEVTEFALEGTLAHAFAAKALKDALGNRDTTEERETIDRLQRFYTKEMEYVADEYAERVIAAYDDAQIVDKEAQLLIEERVALPYEPGKRCYGTADAIVLNDWALEVFDFKYGKGVKVEAEDNPQMMIYAIGAFERMRQLGIPVPDEVNLTIIQPRINNISTWNTTRGYLCFIWLKDVLVPRMEEAMSELARAQPGDWCRFCAARHECRELAAYCLGTQAQFPIASDIDTDTLARDVLPRLTAIKAWVKDMEERGLKEALDGKALPGFKLVEGRSVRKISDPEAVANALMSAGVAEPWRPRELKTLTELEKTVGKKAFGELCGQWLTKAPGKPTLVAEDDPRRPYNAANEFAGIDITKI